jgi:hypothetical protein
MEYNANGEIWEVPMSVGAFGPFRIPFGGGGYLRFYPLPLTEALFRCMGEKGKSSILYVHPWELDVAHPHVQAPLSRRLRHYFGIRRMEKKLVILLQSLKFDTASNVLKSIMKSL